MGRASEANFLAHLKGNQSDTGRLGKENGLPKMAAYFLRKPYKEKDGRQWGWGWGRHLTGSRVEREDPEVS